MPWNLSFSLNNDTLAFFDKTSSLKKSKSQLLASFDPNGVALQNGHFIGLPFEAEHADLYLLGVPWDVTVSFVDGTSSGAQNILEASTQLDLYDEEYPGAWQRGIYFEAHPASLNLESAALRKKARQYIHYLESGKKDREEYFANELKAINAGCAKMVEVVKKETTQLLNQGKLVGLVGGDHSTPLGFLQALAEKHKSFGILQIDAHQDLRAAYEGFEYSHASIFYNALKIPAINQLTQVGIRDYCDAEIALSEADERIETHSNISIRSALFKGMTWDTYADKIIASLPQKVYISFDIDGLDPALCPNTGTPVPGGLQMSEVFYLVKKIVDSGREIIGFDLSEVAGIGNDWDGNVGARILYKLCGAILMSNEK